MNTDGFCSRCKNELDKRWKHTERTIKVKIMTSVKGSKNYNFSGYRYMNADKVRNIDIEGKNLSCNGEFILWRS